MTPSSWGRHVRALGLPGLLGVLLAGGSAWVLVAWVPERQEQVQMLASQVRQLRHELQSGSSPGSGHAAKGGTVSDVSPVAPDQAWQSVWDALPVDSQRLEILKRVTSSAAKMGVSSQSIQYQGALEDWSVHAGQALWRQRLTLPVQGRYGDVRAWIGTLLSRSYVSLDTLDIQRSDTTSDQVSGRISLSLWWRVDQGGTP